MGKQFKSVFSRNCFAESCAPKTLQDSSKIWTRAYTLILIVIFVCVVLFVVLMKELHDDQDQENPSYRGLEILPKWLNFGQELSDCENRNCSIICNNSTDFIRSLKSSVSRTHCTRVTRLVIENQKFPNGTLQADWIKFDRQIIELAIRDSVVFHIADDAFVHQAFSNTVELLLENLSIATLSGHILLGLPELRRLEILACPIIKISPAFFQPVRTTLNYLKMTHMTETVQFDEIFGDNQMLNLEILSLDYNHFTKPITTKGFSKLPTILMIKMHNSHIQEIGHDAFRHIAKTIRLLDLSHNNLTTLPFLSFRGLLVHSRVNVYLRENQWHCDCSLKPLADYYDKYAERFFIAPICKSPQAFYGEVINNVKLCDDNSTELQSTVTSVLPTLDTGSSEADMGSSSAENTVSSTHTTGVFNSTESVQTTISVQRTSVTIPSTETISTTDGDDITVRNLNTSITTVPSQPPGVNLTCSTRLKDSSNSDEEEIPVREFLILDSPCFEFNITPVTENSIKIDIKRFRKSLIILWFTDPDTYNSQVVSDPEDDALHCRVSTTGNFIIGDLIDNASYTFCLVSKNQSIISPFNCRPYHNPVRNSNATIRTWLDTGKKQIVAGVYSTVLIVSIAVGAFGSYEVIKRNPYLLKGSKRVIIVKKGDQRDDCSAKEKKCPKQSSFQNLTSFRKKKITPPPPYEPKLPREVSYEMPIEVLENLYSVSKKVGRTTFCSTEDLESVPKSPPPLPKRNSEPIYRTTDKKLGRFFNGSI